MAANEQPLRGSGTWASLLPAPVSEEEHLRNAWHVSVLMFSMAALSLLATLVGPDPNPSDHGAVLILAGVMGASAIVWWLVGPRKLLLRFGNIWGTIALSAFIAFARPIAATGFFYMWPILHAAYFFGRRDAIATVITMAVSFGAALTFFHDPGMRQLLWTGTVLSLAVLGAVMLILRERINRLVAELHESSSTDPLTALLNRRAFTAIFDSELERAQRAGTPLTLAIFDLDHFKRINDRFGHEAGDRALRRFAAVLRAEQRHADPIARIGGEEFAVLLIGADAEGGRQFALRIANSPDLIAEGELMHVCAGLASFGGELHTQDDLLRAADAALYEAKAAGRHRVAMHGGGITEATGRVRPISVKRGGVAEAR